MCVGYVYVVITRECITQKLDIYKIGRSENVLCRIKDYPKGSVLLFTDYVKDCITMENKIKSALKNSSCKHRRDFGEEYFEGSLFSIKYIVRQTINVEEKNNEGDISIYSKNDVDDIRTIQQLFIQFKDDNNTIFSGIFKISEIYNIFNVWQYENTKKTISYKKFIKLVFSLTDVKQVSFRFSDGIHQAFDFTQSNESLKLKQFVDECIVKDDKEFFTLKEAKDSYLQKDYCSLQLFDFKENLEQILDTICLDKMLIGDKIKKRVFKGFHLQGQSHIITKIENEPKKTNIKKAQNEIETKSKNLKDIEEFIQSHIFYEENALLPLKTIKDLYKKSNVFDPNIPLKKEMVQNLFKAQFYEIKKVESKTFRNVFINLKCCT